MRTIEQNTKVAKARMAITTGFMLVLATKFEGENVSFTPYSITCTYKQKNSTVSDTHIPWSSFLPSSFFSICSFSSYLSSPNFLLSLHFCSPSSYPFPSSLLTSQCCQEHLHVLCHFVGRGCGCWFVLNATI